MNVQMLDLNNNYIIQVMDKQLVLILINMMIFLLKKVQGVQNLTMNLLKKLLVHNYCIIYF